MKNGSKLSLIGQYSRLMDEGGRANLRRLMVRAVLGGVLEGGGLLCILGGASALGSPGGSAFGLGTGSWIAVLAVLAAAGFVLAYYLAMASYRTALSLMRHCHEVVGDKFSILPLGWFGHDDAGKYSRAVTSGMLAMSQGVAHTLAHTLSRVAVVLVLMSGLWIWNPRLAVVATAALPIYSGVIWFVARAGKRVRHQAEPAKVALSQRLIEFVSCQGALRSAGRAADPPQLSAAIAAEKASATRLLWLESGLLMLAGVFSQLIVVTLIAVAGTMAVAGQLGVVEAIAFMGVCLAIVHAISAIGEGALGLVDQSPALMDINEVLDTPTLPVPLGSAGEVTEPSITVEGVTFGYGARPVLQDVSFTIPPRTMTALVGPSGAGKTTVARLIGRFYDVDEGAIRLGGLDVRELTTADLMAQLSMVFQDVYLFDDTLEANVRVGRPDATGEELERAAALAGVTEIVARLPEGWQTRAGEGGGRLSGGERQRVSIARALLKRAPIVLIDEATSALDVENEGHIREALETLRAKSTVLVIAHKLDTIRNADQIVVLDAEGRVCQVGRHEELVGQDGIYRGFWQQRERVQGWQLA